MNKKSFILVSAILFVIFVCSSFVYATNDVKNAVNGATNTVVDGVDRLGSDVRDGIGDAENGVEDALNMNDKSTDNPSHGDDNDRVTTDGADMVTTGDYTATRTTADATTNATTSTNASSLWIWLIIAIAAIVIVGLVWYYGTQNSNTHHDE